MAIKYGFFNSVSGDRLYNADDVSGYFKGLIGDGVYEDYLDALRVVSNNNHRVIVKPGRAMIEGHYIENTEDYEVIVTQRDLPAWNAISVVLDREHRQGVIVLHEGVASSNPVKPVPAERSDYKEMILAYVYTPAGPGIISQSQIEDTRADSNLCGWVTGLVKQVDTSTLFAQWQAAYAEFYASFQSWFETLTQELTVNEYIKAYDKVSAAGSLTATISLDMDGYTYEASDIVNVYSNGFELIPGFDYTIEAGSPAKVKLDIHSQTSTRRIHIRVLKNVIGNPPSVIPTIEEETEFTVSAE